MEVNITEYINVDYDKERHFLYTSMHRTISSEELRNTISFVANFIKNENVKYWIADTRLLNGILISDQLWVLRKIVPIVIKSDLQKLAQVGNSDIFHYMSFENLVQQAYKMFNTGIAFEQFITYDAALDWIALPE
ncbi:hypothetical protein ACFSKU_05295 [Pontibacter silvestris]|uniref:STAS/SEC14 domain-containing protein n=1 Tax=Pontibacter silvestris TaxID=2305183 RepID=A0ABW4WWB3_9BACT|nr:hypothetical protein [Pontibacter silvestris]MCC9136953.1 hypothetical protein [Pontibacter silvestris]